MASLADRTGISIPQGEIENMPELVVPVDFRKRFQSIHREAAETVPLRFLAAAVLHDEHHDRSTEEIIAAAHHLTAVDEFLQDNPGAPIMHAAYSSLDTGIAAEASGVFFRNSFVRHYTTPYIIIPTAQAFSARLGADGTSHFNRSELGYDAVSFEDDRLEIVFMPDVVLTPRHQTISIDEAVGKMDGGVLAVGEKPVSDLTSAMAERELGEGNRRGDYKYEYSLALLGAAALRNQGAELTIGTNGDLIHETVREMLARLVAKGFGDRQHRLGSMGRVSRRLSAAALTEADLEPIKEQAVALLTRGTAYDGLTAMASRNGGSLDEAVRSNTRSVMQNLMGIEFTK